MGFLGGEWLDDIKFGVGFSLVCVFINDVGEGRYNGWIKFISFFLLGGWGNWVGELVKDIEDRLIYF